MPMSLTRRAAVALAAAVLAPAWAAPSPAAGADWPAKTVQIIVSYAPGGSTDTLARKIADELGQQVGESIIVQNYNGAGGTLGTTKAAHAPADGSVLFLGQISSHGIAPALYSKLNYDPVADFTPVVRVYSVPNVMVVPKDFPADTYAEFLEIAKTKKLRFASSGVGSSIHLSGELFKAATGLDLVHVPFRGSGEAVPALLGGNVDLMFDNAPSAIPHIRSGELKALAVTTAKRSPALPDVPTLQEVGGPDLKDFAVQAWFGIFVPGGSDAQTVAAINAQMNAVLASDGFKKFAESQAASIDGGTPEDLQQHVAAELTKWTGVVDAAGIPKK